VLQTSSRIPQRPSDPRHRSPDAYPSAIETFVLLKLGKATAVGNRSAQTTKWFTDDLGRPAVQSPRETAIGDRTGRKWITVLSQQPHFIRATQRQVRIAVAVEIALRKVDNGTQAMDAQVGPVSDVPSPSKNVNDPSTSPTARSGNFWPMKLPTATASGSEAPLA
jgi:hypothetical protein